MEKTTSPEISKNIIKMMATLNHTKQVFLRTYLSQVTRNATQAYLKARPEAAFSTAKTNGSKLLAETDIKEIMSVYEDESNTLSLNKSLSTRSNLINKAYKVYEKAEQNDQLGVALQGIDLTAKLNRLYEKDREEPGDWSKLVQNILVVNNNITTTTPQVVDGMDEVDITDATIINKDNDEQ